MELINMEKKYYITEEQIETIQYIKRMLALNRDLISDLCSSEKDDIVYGFELGKMYSHIGDLHTQMFQLDFLKEQEIKKDIHGKG